MTATDRYFQLNDDVGVTADGNLEPLVEVGLAINVPTIVTTQDDDGNDIQEVVSVAGRIALQPAEEIPEDGHGRIVPGTRIVHTNDPRVADGLAQSGHYSPVDPPSKRELGKQKSTTEDARNEAGTHDDSGKV